MARIGADDDLILAKTLAVAVGGMATGEVLASVFGALLVLGRQLQAKHVKLDVLQFRVLAALADGPLAASAIAQRVATKAADWSTEDVEEVLRELEAIRRADGSVVALVAKTGDLWRRVSV